MTNLTDILTPTGVATAAQGNKANAAAPAASPSFTGTPTAPTAAAGTNTTQVATTEFLVNLVGTTETLTIAAADTLVHDSAVHKIILFRSRTLSNAVTNDFKVAADWTMTAHTGSVRISFTLDNTVNDNYERAEARVRVNGTTVYTVVNPKGPASTAGTVDVTFVEGDVIDIVHARTSNHGTSVVSLLQMSADNFLIPTRLGKAAL